MPRILYCCPVEVSRGLGTAKHYIELAEGFRHAGWDVELAGPEEIAGGRWPAASADERCRFLADFLKERAGGFDVVEFDYGYLPFLRATFAPRTLLVARAVLLTHHFLKIEIPPRPGWRRWVGQIVRGPSRRRELAHAVELATRTCREADLVIVSNHDDRAELMAHGIAGAKVVVTPIGLTPENRASLQALSIEPPARPRVSYVGTFDPRKGMRDFPEIVARVIAAIPDATFSLLGTAGMLQSAVEVYAEFPKRFWPALEVKPRFALGELPGLLANGSVGVFPSAVEGFGLGVLEMLAAGLPVVAYRVPGPPMMLPDDYLVASGDVRAMADRVIALLRDREKLRNARVWSRQRSRDFDRDEIAARTAAIYEERLATLRGHTPATRRHGEA